MNDDQAKIYFVQNSKYFRVADWPIVESQIAEKTEEETILISSEMKSPGWALFWAIVLGHLGVDRFYIGDKRLGIVKLLLWLTVVGADIMATVESTKAAVEASLMDNWVFWGILWISSAVWWISDCIRIMSLAKRKNLEMIMTYGGERGALQP